MARRLRISIVNGICLAKDAISESVRGTAIALERNLDADTRIYCYNYDFADINAIKVQGVADLIFDEFFRTSDIVIYHFGVYYDLFNSIYLLNKNQKSIVRYHNVTPKELLPKESSYLIDKSIAQQANIDIADLVLADSNFNRDCLIEYGLPADRIEVVPLYSRFDRCDISVGIGSSELVKLLYVGRFVESKGVLDLVKAVALIEDRSRLRLTLIGNEAFSDQAYIKKIRRLIRDEGLDDVVVFEGTVDDQTLAEHYRGADAFVLPSYHEGFCVPVLEALRFGCVPIAYSAGNLPELIGPYGLIVETGDIQGLSNAIASLSGLFAATDKAVSAHGAEWRKMFRDRSYYNQAVAEHLVQFEFDTFARRLSDIVEKILSDMPHEHEPHQGMAI